MDQCLVDGSPWLFAVTHVLHRFLAPRHPPLALCSLEEQRCSCSLCSSQGAQHDRAMPAVGAQHNALAEGRGRRWSTPSERNRGWNDASRPISERKHLRSMIDTI